MAVVKGQNVAFLRIEGETDGAWKLRSQNLLDKLREISDKVDVDSGDVVGLLVVIPLFSDWQYYHVVKAKPLTLEHIPFLSVGHPRLLAPEAIRAMNVPILIDRERTIRAAVMAERLAAIRRDLTAPGRIGLLNVDYIAISWVCDTCGGTALLRVADLSTSGTPLCVDCDEDMTPESVEIVPKDTA